MSHVKTKVVCTIGPATSSKSVLLRLAKAGMDVARLNLSHERPKDHARRMRNIRATEKDSGIPIGVLADLPGPRIRIGKLVSEPIHLRDGSRLTLTGRKVLGSSNLISVSHPSVLSKLRKGDSVFLADGTIRLQVTRAKGTQIECTVARGGPLFSGKGVNLPGKALGLRAITAKDIELLKWAVRIGVDFIGISFTASASDIVQVKRIVREMGGDVWVVAKIERRQAVERLDEIVREADCLMVARGDLGVEMNLEEVPVVQKKIVEKANAAGKPVIIATQMLESMVYNPTPTRAEVTDIANAIVDGTDAVMLSEETAVGRFPVEAVAVMKRVAAETESVLRYSQLIESRRELVRGVQDAISHSACEVAYSLRAKCVVAHTRTGMTAQRVSKFRSPVPIIALTFSPTVMRRLTILWGVYPRKVGRLRTTAQIFSIAKKVARNTGAAPRGSKIVVVCGDPSTPGGTTDLMRVQTV